MAYSMAIQTPQGLVDISDIRVARHYGTFSYTSQSGSRYEPNFTDANGTGHIACIANDLKLPPSYTWDESTKTLSWTIPPNYQGFINSSDFSTSFRFVFWSFN